MEKENLIKNGREDLCEKMVGLNLKYGLPFCDVNICYNGKFIYIRNVLLNTGAGGSVFKMDVVEDIGIRIEDDDVIESISGIGSSNLSASDFGNASEVH